MLIIVTDEDARRRLSVPEALEAMHACFRDLAEGKAVNPPRLRYGCDTADDSRRYSAIIHAGAVQSYRMACGRAGSHFVLQSQQAGPLLSPGWPRRSMSPQPDASSLPPSLAPASWRGLADVR